MPDVEVQTVKPIVANVPTVLVPAPPPPMAPLQSTTVRALIFVGVGQMLFTMLPMLQAHKFDLWALGSLAIPIVGGICVRMASSDVRLPFTKAAP